MALRPRRSTGWLYLAVLVTGCSDPASCPPWSTVSWDAFGEPEAPGLMGPLLRDPKTGRVPRVTDAELDTVWLDPAPHQRGEHLMWRVTRGPKCEVLAVPTIGGPALAPARAEPFGPPLPDRRMGALVLNTEEVLPEEPSDEWRAWERALGDLGVSGLSLSGFSGLEGDNSVEATLEARLAATSPGGVFVLVLSGPGTSAGPGLVFARSGGTSTALSFGRLTATLGRAATHLGLLVWVVDTSYAAEVRLPIGVPAVLVRGSDRFAPDTPRADHGGPSALALAFEAALTEARAGRCVDTVTDPGELAALLYEAATHVRPHLLRLRWERIGLPALARLAAMDTLTPQHRDRLATWLERQAPRELVADNLRGAGLPAEDVCTTDRECASRDACLGPCSVHRCVAGRCVAAPTPDVKCNDGDECTENDRCDDAGECVGDAVTCDDGDECTDEACEPGRGCVATPASGRACDDGDACTDHDVCDAGQCLGTTSACDDGDPCTVDTCTPELGCRHERRDGLACDDGDPCTLGDRCQAGLCLGVSRPCGDDNPCTADRCDRATGACVFVPLADFVSCVDDDPCTSASRCIAGRCEGLVRTCDDGIACTLDRCAADGGCQHLPAPGTCLSPVPGEGCIPVGSSPASDPCLTCVATGVFAMATDGTSCGAGEGCAARRCLGGRCVVRDDAQSCSTPEGECVAVGEPITECLTCLGSGVASPRLGSCAGPPACGIGTCFDGACHTTMPRPCCPPRVMACGEVWEVDEHDFAGLGSRVDVWVGGAAPGPERWLEVVAPCDGTMALTVQPVGPTDGAAVLVLDAAACVPGLATAGSGATPPYPSGPLGTAFTGLEVGTNESVRLALEVTGRGRWLVTSACQCTP